MELIHKYKSKVAQTGYRTALRQSVWTFVHRHAETFEALTRTGNPFGGNWLPRERWSTGYAPARTTDNELTHVQRQVNELSRTVAQLSDQVNQLSVQTPVAGKPDALTATEPSAGYPAHHTSQIGINRYRSLQK